LSTTQERESLPTTKLNQEVVVIANILFVVGDMKLYAETSITLHMMRITAQGVQLHD